MKSGRVSPARPRAQQMCFPSSLCKGELGARESGVLQTHLLCKALGRSSFKILQHYLAEKIIPTRKYAFYFKTTLQSGSAPWRRYSCFQCLSQRFLFLQDLFFWLPLTSVALAEPYTIVILILGKVCCLFIQLKEQLQPRIMRIFCKSQVECLAFWRE